AVNREKYIGILIKIGAQQLSPCSSAITVLSFLLAVEMLTGISTALFCVLHHKRCVLYERYHLNPARLPPVLRTYSQLKNASKVRYCQPCGPDLTREPRIL